MNRLSRALALLGLAAFFTLFFQLQVLHSQTYIIGTDGGINTAASYPTPYAGLHRGMRAQYLYLASELQAAGLNSPRTITQLGFIIEDANGIGEIENLRFFLSNTSTQSLDTILWEPTGELVFDTAAYTPTVGSGNVLLLEAPFTWDGSSNLLLEVCHTNDAPTFNASVNWTEGLGFNASRTFWSDDDPTAICGTLDTMQAGDQETRPVLLLRFGCYAPDTVMASVVNSTTSNISWSASGGAGATYEWMVGLSGFPPLIDSAVVSGTTTDTFAIVTGLGSLLDYDVYVRTRCSASEVSEWVGPGAFGTPAGCGDLFADSGGELGDYADNESVVTVICPDTTSELVSLKFALFDLGMGDTLRIFNGNSLSDPLIGAFGSGNFPPLPAIFSATTASGCLTVQFESDAAQTGLGWEAAVNCGLPDSCFTLIGLELEGVSGTTATFDWSAMFGATGYAWQIGVQPFNIGDVPLQIDTTTQSALTVTGLLPSTKYDFYVRTLCDGDDSEVWQHVAFFTTPDCFGGNVIACNNPTFASMAGAGVWDINVCDPSLPTIGKERIFRFTAPNTRDYRIAITSITGAGNVFVDYLFKPVANGCDATGWDCAGYAAAAPDTLPLGPLVAGVQYFILLDPESTATTSHTFKIIDCGPLNDEASEAAAIEVDVACAGNIYSNEGAGFNQSEGEPNPDENPSDGYLGRWFEDGELKTVWFKFVAPPSGTITITTDGNVQGSNYDTQLALYAVGDSSKYNTFQLLESDDDSGTVGLGTNAVLSYNGLTPGQTYYIQVDGFGVVFGTFCIEVLEGAPRALTTECLNAGGRGYRVPNVNGTVPGGDRWYGIYTTPSAYDLGQLVAAVKPGLQDLDTVICEVSVYEDSIPLSSSNVRYLPAYYNFSSTDMLATGPIGVRIFFYVSEFEALKEEAGAPSATISDLKITHYEGPDEDCSQLNNQVSGSTQTLLSPTVASTGGTFYLEMSIPSMGEIGAHLGATVLPLELKSFSGKIVGSANRLEWTTLAERNVAWHLVERSLNGADWAEVGRKPGLLSAATPTHYALDDLRPFSKTYYRLRSVDADGKEAVSPVIVLTRPVDAFGIASVSPSPTSDQLNVRFEVPDEQNLTLRITDLAGRAVRTQNVDAQRGTNQTALSLGGLPAGIYLLHLLGEKSASAPVKVIKE
jgi:hypothetical protein